jgi:hypothetical protein
MNPTEATQPHANDVVAEALASAKRTAELREAAIQHLLAQQAQIIQNLKILGHQPSMNGNGHGPKQKPVKLSAAASSKRFRNLKLAEAVKILLSETEELHGSEIQTSLQAGGFKGGTKNFQNYLPVALKRAGGFENVGGNRWRLNENIIPVR